MTGQDTVFLTGASGFVGGAVLRQLTQAGFAVRALVRPTSRRDHLDGSGAQIIEGDLREAACLRSAIRGCRFVFHVAADYRLWSRGRSETFASNLDGTRHVMETALAAGVERIVYTSSVATLALPAHGSVSDESASLPEQEGVGAYKRSKIAAEELVRTMIAERALPAVIVNPSTPIGPGDLRPTPTGRIIVEAASGRIPIFVETGLNLAHVDDVASGHLAALRYGRIGERYILGGENVLFSQMLADIAEMVGRRPPRLRIPWYATLPVACVSEGLALFSGREPLATINGVRMSRHHMFFTAAKAERELRYRARPYREALQNAVRWFYDKGYLAPRVRLTFGAGAPAS
ncbi:MAG TPA: hopanoid-associated sugar epimerase [Pseudolabrys sp.]|nr:hopanoid-associated sugar epimerase [Pseudolabrys sp.]